ncbi:hypothetical protein PV11_05952 [Exophiala sideris]|uniref:G-protein coupled receptors family 1 profile domain-containing protein n=1 Tax=Exophiala sideris TaxID=1016849 RepID=A0A0D1YM75_9EURO|nr:hypothetical protein PV11_05952 [Exophiala sideris]
MAANVTPTMASTAPTVFPTAGVGGEYYETAFQVPTYSTGAINVISWSEIDDFSHIIANYSVSEGIATGLIWATLIYLLALTPGRKRTTPFHTCLLLGLVFMLLHLMLDIIAVVTPGLSTNSSYVVLTGDVASSVWTNKYIAIYIICKVANWLAFIFATTCLWLQAKGLLSGVKVRFNIVYRIILTYLALTALAALISSMIYWIHQIMVVKLDPTPTMDYYMLRMKTTYLVTYALSIGSFSLVSICSVLDIVWRRPSSVIKSNNAFSSALNLVGLLGAQSFIVPFIFCILEVAYSQNSSTLPETILLPSVYLILPLGSLFMTVHTIDVENQKGAEAPQSSASPTKACFDKSPTSTMGSLTISGSEAGSYTLGEASAETPSKPICTSRHQKPTVPSGGSEAILLGDLKEYGQKSSVQEV